MTVKQIFRWIGGGIVALLFAILGIQRKKIVKQKEEIKVKKEEVKQAEAQAEQAVKVEKVTEVSDLRRQENAIQFRLLTSLVKCIKFGTCNGELEEAEKLMNDYFHTGVVR